MFATFLFGKLYYVATAMIFLYTSGIVHSDFNLVSVCDIPLKGFIHNVNSVISASVTNFLKVGGERSFSSLLSVLFS